MGTQLLACGFLPRGGGGGGGGGGGEDLITALAPVDAVPADARPVPGGWGFALAVTSTGDLVAWGSNRQDLLPATAGTAAAAADGGGGGGPVVVARGVTAAAAGYDFAVYAAADGGTLFEAGPHARAPAPVPLPAGVRVAAVAAGERHALLLSAAGDVFGFGCGADGQLGHAADALPERGWSSAPLPILGPSAAGAAAAPPLRRRAVALAAGARHSLAATDEGRCVAWGWSLHGQCGGDGPVTAAPPAVVARLGPLRVVGVAAGGAHSVAVTDEGDAYAWGQNADGQLGCRVGAEAGEGEREGGGAGRKRRRVDAERGGGAGSDSAGSGSSSDEGDLIGGASTAEPVLVGGAALEGEWVEAVAAGARHTLLVCRGGAAYAAGWGRWGQLGGAAPAAGAVARVEVLGGAPVVAAACGWWHSTFLVRTTVL